MEGVRVIKETVGSLLLTERIHKYIKTKYETVKMMYILRTNNVCTCILYVQNDIHTLHKILNDENDVYKIKVLNGNNNILGSSKKLTVYNEVEYFYGVK